jgi:hypothetical protein
MHAEHTSGDADEIQILIERHAQSERAVKSCAASSLGLDTR